MDRLGALTFRGDPDTWDTFNCSYSPHFQRPGAPCFDMRLRLPDEETVTFPSFARQEARRSDERRLVARRRTFDIMNTEYLLGLSSIHAPSPSIRHGNAYPTPPSILWSDSEIARALLAEVTPETLIEKYKVQCLADDVEESYEHWLTLPQIGYTVGAVEEYQKRIEPKWISLRYYVPLYHTGPILVEVWQRVDMAFIDHYLG